MPVTVTVVFTAEEAEQVRRALSDRTAALLSDAAFTDPRFRAEYAANQSASVKAAGATLDAFMLRDAMSG